MPISQRDEEYLEKTSMPHDRCTLCSSAYTGMVKNLDVLNYIQSF